MCLRELVNQRWRLVALRRRLRGLVDERFRLARLLRLCSALGQRRSTYYKPKNQQAYFLERMCQRILQTARARQFELLLGVASRVRYGFSFFFAFVFLFRRDLNEYVRLQQGTM